jgi:hypothetical protein
MRKLTALVAALTVISGVAFAEPLFRWSASAGGVLSVNGFNQKQLYTDAYGMDHQGRLGEGGEYNMPWMYIGGLYNQERRIFNLGATVANEDNTLGAWLSIETSIPHYSGVNFSGLGFVWWQPLQQFKARLGLSEPTEGDPFGLFLVDTGYIPVRMYGSAVNSVSGGVHHWWNPQRVHHGYGRESVMAATLELFPLKNLYITSSTPFEPLWNGARGGSSSVYESNVLDILAQTAVQVSYNFPGIGIAALTWDGGTMQVDQDPLINTNWLPGGGGGMFFDDPAFITVGFSWTTLYNSNDDEGALFYVGFDAPLPSTKWRSGHVITRPATPGVPEEKEWRKGSENFNKIFIQRPFGPELRAYYSTGAFQVVAGVAANFGGYTAYKPEGGLFNRVNMPFTIGATINPQYNFGFMKTGLVAEFKYHAAQKQIAEPYTMFNIIPYVQKSIANGAVWAAVQVEGVALDNSDDLNPSAIKSWKQGILWSVLVGFKYSL